MYRCHIHFYLVGCPHEMFDTIKAVPPLEHFTHTFLESDEPHAQLAAQADVIFVLPQAADVEGTLRTLAAHREKKAEVILLAGWEQAMCMTDGLFTDVWPVPMPESALKFRFQTWQRTYKENVDYWQTSQFLDAAMNSSPDLVWYKNREGIHVKVNDSFCKVAGKTKQDVEGRRHAYIWDVEQDDPACIESEREVMERRETCVAEEIVQTGGGRMVLRTYKSPLYDLDGSVMGTVGIGIDITRERAFEREIGDKNQEITDKNRTLEMLFSTMDCGIMCHSLDGKQVISVNQAALRLLDYGSQEELLKDGFNLVAQSVLDEDKPKLRNSIKSLKKPGDSVSVEYRVLHKDGKILHILGNVKLIEEAGELYYQRFLLDYTEQKLQEAEKWAQKDQELQYQEQMFEVFSAFLSDNVDDVYMVLNSDGRIIEFVTPNVERVLGISAEDLLADAEAIGHAKYITGYEVGNEGLAALEPGMSLEPMETERIHQKTGAHKWLRESVYCVSIQGIKKIVVYISDRTRERVTQDSLTEALEMARAANKAKSTFLSNISHDIRTPMNAIMGFIPLLREDADNPEHVVEYTQKISAASQHLLGLINDVLDMNKIESGSTVLNISDLNMADLIDELNAIIRPQARAKNQTFDIHVISLTQEHLLGDKLRINQILINILSNAVKYTHEGGRIEMKVTELPQVSQNYSRVRFTIRDNGQGMSEAYQRVIFDPFTREQESTWNQIQGTGLGMAITKNLVDLMGGTIEVDSQLGKGSTFTVELELRIQEREDDPKFWDRHGIIRMIVADDDESVCQDIAKKMGGTGVSVHYVTDGSQAIDTIRTAREQGEPYDLMLLDWKMPGLDGLETARLIRKNYPERIPILLFTAYDWADIEQEALEVGIDHFLPKPFFMSSFKDTIRRVRGDKEIAAVTDGSESTVVGKRVLVVDDIEVNRMILVKILATLGASCDTAIDGQEAADKFAESQPGEYDLILMDIQMPKLNGYEATKMIRSSGHPSAQSVAIIAMTANAFAEDVRDALDAGMDAHVSKPIVLGQLKRTIQEVLERKR